MQPHMVIVSTDEVPVWREAQFAHAPCLKVLTPVMTGIEPICIYNESYALGTFIKICKAWFPFDRKDRCDRTIAQFCDQRSLRRNGNRLVQFASDRCVTSDPCV